MSCSFCVLFLVRARIRLLGNKIQQKEGQMM